MPVGGLFTQSCLYQSPLKDRSYASTKHFRRSRLKNLTVTKNDEPISPINVMYLDVLGKKPMPPLTS